MKIDQERKTVKELFDGRQRINLNPQWQRGPAWKLPRQVLLVDSILRGMDIPKVYLRVRTDDAVFGHDAVDGQQRLRAIWEFREGEWGLDHTEPLDAIEGNAVAGKKFGELPKLLRDRFDRFEVSIGEITEGSNDEISSLFSRLQMGVALNPAELRNALLNPLNRIMASIAEGHEFFANCRIPSSRSKHLDYITHGFAVLKWGTTHDIKAPDLKSMVTTVLDADEVLELGFRAGEVLNVLDGVNAHLGYRITQKWSFVDLFILISQREQAGVEVDPVKLGMAYEEFEAKRKHHNAQPEVLLGRTGAHKKLDKHLYDYIMAFRAQGGTKESLHTRNETLRAFCPDIDART